jgi:hypothetical protein
MTGMVSAAEAGVELQTARSASAQRNMVNFTMALSSRLQLAEL